MKLPNLPKPILYVRIEGTKNADQRRIKVSTEFAGSTGLWYFTDPHTCNKVFTGFHYIFGDLSANPAEYTITEPIAMISTMEQLGTLLGEPDTFTQEPGTWWRFRLVMLPVYWAHLVHVVKKQVQSRRDKRRFGFDLGQAQENIAKDLAEMRNNFKLNYKPPQDQEE